MTDMQIEQDYRKLVNKMAAKRAVERFMLGFIALCLLGVMALLFFQNRSLNTEIRNQRAASAAQSKFIIQSQKQTAAQTKEIKSYVLCIGEFFKQTNRQNETLDLTTCDINTSAFAPISPSTIGSRPQSAQVSIAKPSSSSSPPASSGSPPAHSQPSLLQRAVTDIKNLL